MGVLTIPLGVGITNNPVKDSPFVDIVENPGIPPIPPQLALLAEDGDFILTEDGEFLTTE